MFIVWNNTFKQVGCFTFNNCWFFFFHIFILTYLCFDSPNVPLPVACGCGSSTLPKSNLIQAQSIELTLPSKLKSPGLVVLVPTEPHSRLSSDLSIALIAQIGRASCRERV